MDWKELAERVSNHPDKTDDVQPAKPAPAFHAVTMQEVDELRQSKGYHELPVTKLENGGLLLRARAVDSFCFVDHPRVELDPTGRRVVSYTCDCPQWRADRSLCVHCAALMQGLDEIRPVYGSAAEDLPNVSEAETQVSKQEDAAVDTQAQEPEGPGLMDFSYKFCNTRTHLYPLDKKPEIPLERFKQMYGNNARAIKLYKDGKRWGGSCFGFASTTAMFYEQDSGIALSDFNPDAQIPSQLALNAYNEKIGMTIHSFIEAMQITQSGNSVWHDLTPDQLAAATEAFQKGEGRPLSMGVQKTARSRGGHAVLPFRLERTDGPEDILHIYDPNYPLQTRYAYLEKNGEGSYIHWRFPMNDHETFGSKTGGILDHAPYDVFYKIWENRGGRENKNLIIVQPGAALLDAAGALVARVTKNTVEIYRNDIVLHPIKTGEEVTDAILSVPMETFRVALEDPELQELTVVLIGVDLAVELSTQSREAELYVNDEVKVASVRITTPGVRYAVGILSTLDETEEETVLSGITNPEELYLMQEFGQLYGSGITADAMLYVNWESVPLSTIGQIEELTEEEQEDGLRIANTASETAQEPESRKPEA